MRMRFQGSVQFFLVKARFSNLIWVSGRQRSKASVVDRFISQFEPDDLKRVGWPIIIIEISVGINKSSRHRLCLSLPFPSVPVDHVGELEIPITKFPAYRQAGKLQIEPNNQFFRLYSFRNFDYWCLELNWLLVIGI